jgi:uncharacterized OB-fold protein
MSEKDNKTTPCTPYSFQQYLNAGKLMASRCADCQEIYLPVRGLCPECGASNLEWVEMTGKGKLAAYTSVYVGPSFMNAEGFGRENPYLTGIVELDEGPMISARLLGLDEKHPEKIKIGTRMIFSTVEIGEGEDTYAQLAFQFEG